MSVYTVIKSPREDLALSNEILVNPSTFSVQATPYLKVDGKCIFTAREAKEVPLGSLGTTKIHREWGYLSLNQKVQVEPISLESLGKSIYLSSLDLEVQTFKKGVEVRNELDVNEMGKMYITNFKNQMFTKGQAMLFEYQGVLLKVLVYGVEVVDLTSIGDVEAKISNLDFGILLEQTTVRFTKAPSSSLKLIGTKSRSAARNLIQPSFKFEDMGIGGLDTEFSAIFRRAFASRVFPPSIVEKLGIQHVKGLLLYGPPGTGKTLMARQIGTMLNAKEPKIVNGPEILNKFVGQSEENIRKLFQDAEKEYKERGDDSGLHIIIFDELDAICKQRGGKNDGTGVGDSVVNQLLSKLDGVDQLNNILVIGMTNRLDMIDEALLRPGRLEVHMEINLPDEHGRVQILKIHTSKMRHNGILHSDVDLSELAALTKNFSGAEIQGLVKSASSFAFNRHTKVGTLAGVGADLEDLKVGRDDFLAALEEVHPAFGINDDQFQALIRNGIFHFNSHIQRILSDGSNFVDQVRRSDRTPLLSVLLHGPPGSGKSALAASIALESQFPFVKLISPEACVGYSESAKVAYLSKVFSDSYKSPLSVVLVDNLERLLDWVPIGPRFSNSVLQTLMVLLRKPPTKVGNKLLVLCTGTRRSVLDSMDLLPCFDSQILVPNLSSFQEVHQVVESLKLFSDPSDLHSALDQLQGAVGDIQVDLPVKKLLVATETAAQDSDRVDRFVQVVSNLLLDR